MTATDDFRYDLPEGSIAQAAIEPRHDARLLDTRDGSDHRFLDLPALLREGDLVVVNRTRVRAARLRGTKATGGAVEALLLRPHADGTWEALVRPARRLRPGTLIDFQGEAAEVVAGPIDGIARLRFTAGPGIEDRLEQIGEVPLPPYFHGEVDPVRYQTMFAKVTGSAAAPTAALHFTPRVTEGLAAAGVEIAEVELDVGLDTFRPIATERIEDHEMHTEQYVVPDGAAEAIGAVRRRGGRVVAIGTTVVRTLESAARPDGTVAPAAGITNLFITPGYRFRAVDLLVTNFHVPGSTLMVLLAAFLGDAWRDAYATALRRGYGFLSFGDAMLAERSP